MKRLLTALFAVLIFLVPSNLFLTLSTPNAYVRGLLVDYLIPKLYLSDIVLLLFIGLSVFYLGFSVVTGTLKNNLYKVLAILVIAVVLSQVKVSHPTAAIVYLLQLAKIILLLFVIHKSTFLYKSGGVMLAFMATVLFQGSLALYQFFAQQSLFGYWFLGEPELNYSLGLAREQVYGVERLLPYGTTAHPNILGGILSAYLIILAAQFGVTQKAPAWQKTLYYLSLIVGTAALWATQSFSAWLACGVGLLVVLVTNRSNRSVFAPVSIAILVIASLVTPIMLARYANTAQYFPSTSISRRVTLNVAAIEMIKKNPLVGVGLNQFTVQIENYVPAREVVRFIQPAHSVLLLWTAETGILGLLLLVTVAAIAWRHNLKTSLCLLLFIPIAVLDHYLLTLQSGLLLLAITSTYFQYFSTQK